MASRKTRKRPAVIWYLSRSTAFWGPGSSSERQQSSFSGRSSSGSPAPQVSPPKCLTQLGRAAQTFLYEHPWLAQSAFVAHARPAAHRGVLVFEPPQSTSLSSPFLRPSSGRGAVHRPATQLSLEHWL